MVGAVHVKDAASAPAAAAATSVTAPGIASGVADTVAEAPAPVEFSARSWKLWAVPLARPVTVWEVAPAPPEMSAQAP